MDRASQILAQGLRPDVRETYTVPAEWGTLASIYK